MLITQTQLPQQAEKENDVLGVMLPKQVAYQNIFASVVKIICALRIEILVAMTVTNILQSHSD